MSEQSEALKERTIVFAINVLKLIDKFPDTTGARVIGYQLAKCAPSVGANYRAACNARSRAEFIAKLGIVVHRMRLVDAPEVRELLQEATELRAIFSRSAGTARANSQARRMRGQMSR